MENKEDLEAQLAQIKNEIEDDEFELDNLQWDFDDTQNNCIQYPSENQKEQALDSIMEDIFYYQDELMELKERRSEIQSKIKNLKEVKNEN